jgi:hypothetical protein
MIRTDLLAEYNRRKDERSLRDDALMAAYLKLPEHDQAIIDDSIARCMKLRSMGVLSAFLLIGKLGIWLAEVPEHDLFEIVP